MSAGVGYYHDRVSFPGWLDDFFDPLEIGLLRAVLKRLVDGHECYPRQDTLGRDIKRSGPTVCRLSAFLERVGALLVTRRGRRETRLYDLPKWLQYARPPAWLKERIAAVRAGGEVFIFSDKSISTPIDKTESFFKQPPTESSESPTSEEGFFAKSGGDTAGIEGGAPPEADRPPHSAVAAVEVEASEATPSPAATEAPLPAEASGPSAPSPDGSNLSSEPRPFVPLHCRRRVPPEERERRYQLLRDQKIPRLLRLLPQGEERASAYFLELMEAPDDAAQRVIVDRYDEAFDAREYDIDHVPLHEWKVRQGIPVKPYPPQQTPPPPAEPAALSKHDQYRQSAKIVAEELARRAAGRAQP